MVFSQTSLKTRNILKVVDLDRLKPEKNQQANGLTGVIHQGNNGVMPQGTVPTASFSEEYLKPEQLYASTMLHGSNSEFFQELDQLCSDPEREEQTRTIDSHKETEKRACSFDTPHTSFCLQGWDVQDDNSPYGQAGFYSNTSMDTMSPAFNGFALNNDLGPIPEEANEVQFPEQFLDISSLPVVIGGLTSAAALDDSWAYPEPVNWTDTFNTDNTINTATQKTLPLTEDDSCDAKIISFLPSEVENCDVFLPKLIDQCDDALLQKEGMHKCERGLSIDVGIRTPSWPADAISTPEVLSYVEQLEKEKCSRAFKELHNDLPLQKTELDLNSVVNIISPCKNNDYEPVTPKSESQLDSDNEDRRTHLSKRKHLDSDDSDETYTPFAEQTSRKYKRKKSNVPIKEMILALEGSRQVGTRRRGRPPKRRDSTLSSTCSIDENSSNISTQESKYRELRDKNNEASKRSRMNRKLKELQMEQLAIDLEERNKKLRVKADILEELTKKVKDALMAAILQK